MSVCHLDVAIHHHRGADEAHRSHADPIAEVLQLHFERSDLRIGVTVADDTEARGLLAYGHRRILRSAKAYADDRRLAGEPATAELHQHI